MIKMMSKLKSWLQDKAYKRTVDRKEVELPEVAEDIQAKIVRETGLRAHRKDDKYYKVEILEQFLGEDMPTHIEMMREEESDTETIETRTEEGTLREVGYRMETSTTPPLIHDADKMKIRREVLNLIKDSEQDTDIFISNDPRLYHRKVVESYKPQNVLANLIEKPNEVEQAFLQFKMFYETLNIPSQGELNS